MTEKEFAKAVKKYNEIMDSLCREHLTIGTSLTEQPEEKAKWTIRDLVAECDYQLSLYYEGGCDNGDLRYSDDPDERAVWRKDTGKLVRFINHWKPYIEGVKCHEYHSSKYDRG